MPVPNIYEDTSATHGTGALSVPWGTHNDTFCAVMVITSGGEAISAPTQSGADGTWTLIDEAYATGIGIAAYWCRATTGSMSNADVPDSGDHTSAKMFMLQNVVSSGNPINFSDTQTVETATASISVACPSSTVQNCLVFCLAGHAIDTSTPPGGSGWSNASLSGVGFAGQYTTTNGTGGGYMGGVGSKATAGACGTFTHTWAGGATRQANIVFAISDTATVSDTATGTSAGAATVAGVGASTAAGAGSSAGAATAAAVGDEGGNIGTSAGVATVTGVGAALVAGAGAIAGAATAAAVSTETVVVDVPGSLPGSVSTGNWPIALLENGRWRFEITFTSASGATYSGYHAIVSSGAGSGYGLWIFDSALILVDTSDTIQVTQALTWSAGQRVMVDVDMVANELTISGATTGNGVYSIPAGTYWEAGTLWICQWTTAQYTLAATIGDIYGDYGSVAVGASAGAATADAVGQAAVQAAGAAAGAATAAAVGTTAGGVRLGDYGAARELFGSAATSVSVELDTQASGSTIVIVTGGNLTDLATAPTDSEANTWTLIDEVEFGDWPGYGLRAWYCANASGGAAHTFTQSMTQYDESTIVVAEIVEGVSLVDWSSAHVDNGNALTVPAVDITGPAYLLAIWSGDAPTGATATVTASNSYALLDDSTLVDHPNGYVPIALFGRSAEDPTSYGTTFTESPDQGAIMFNLAIQGSEVNAVGSSSGAATAAATGAATADAAGASDGAAAAAATGSATIDAAGSSAGAATAEAVGQAAAQAAGASDGTAEASGAGAATAASSATSDGTAAAAGVGSSLADTAGSAAGAATASATGASSADATGAADGLAEVTGVGAYAAAAAGEAAGAATAAAVGSSSAGAAGASAGAATAAAAGESTVAAAGSSAGAATAEAISEGGGVGSSAGAATVTGAGASTADAAGEGAGAAAISAAGASSADAAGTSSGAASVAGAGAATADATGASSGVATAAAVGDTGASDEAAGSSAGSASVTGAGASTAAAAGATAGTATAAAVAATAARSGPRARAIVDDSVVGRALVTVSRVRAIVDEGDA